MKFSFPARPVLKKARFIYFFQLENSKKSRTDHHDSSEELEKLREEVAALRERQSTFEELESRVKRYEAKSVEPTKSQQRYVKYRAIQRVCNFIVNNAYYEVKNSMNSPVRI